MPDNSLFTNIFFNDCGRGLTELLEMNISPSVRIFYYEDLSLSIATFWWIAWAMFTRNYLLLFATFM